MSAGYLIAPLSTCMSRGEAVEFTGAPSASTEEVPKLRDLLAAERPVVGNHLVLVFVPPASTAVALAVGLLTEVGTRFAWTQTPLREWELDLDSGVENKARWLNERETAVVLQRLAGASTTIATISAPLLAPAATESSSGPTQGMSPAGPPKATKPEVGAEVAPVVPQAKPKPPLPTVSGGSIEPRNIVLHGPPGTGKTFATARRALQLLRVRGVDVMRDAECTAHFRAFQEHGRLMFVTFHQSYGYEEFVEGLRPELDGERDVRYEMHRGIFVRIAMAAREAWARWQGGAETWDAVPFDRVWGALLDRASSPLRLTSVKTTYDFVRRGETLSYLAEGGGEYPVKRSLMDVLWGARSTLGRDPQTQAVAQTLGTRGPNPNAGVYAALWRAAAGIAEEMVVGPLDQYVLVIDEINRGNISKILGELITLLEPDKRLGMSHALELPLAYSPKELFGVPPNLHVLGTMNTADRSIALLDVALRRRFTFEEMMPRPDIIPRVLEANGVMDGDFRDLVRDVLSTINARVRFLLDREHQIGHAYFLGVRSYLDLRDVFAARVIPLLQEYFHGGWERVCIVLGCPYQIPDSGSADPKPARKDFTSSPKYRAAMMTADLLREVATIGFDHDDLDNRVMFEINTAFLDESDAKALIPYFVDVLAESTSAADTRIATLRAGPLGGT